MAEKSILIKKFLKGDLTEDERKELEAWVQSHDDNRAFFEQRIREYDRNSQLDFDEKEAFLKFSQAIDKRKASAKIPVTFLERVALLKSDTFLKPAGILKYAAIFAILLATGLWMKYEFAGSLFQSDTEVTRESPAAPLLHKNESIVLKLQDGSTQEIDSESDGTVQDALGNVVANKNKDGLTFGSDRESENAPILYNEIFIPNGQKFKIQLSDGTWVWLNSGSRLRFPQHFAKSLKSREVFLEGEAYFDVSSNREKPFIVNAQNVNIEVLGTEFNLSAYSTDNTIATTLIEGEVQVYETETPENQILLNPKYQAKFNKKNRNLDKKKVDTQLYTAWMQNRLIINNLTFPEILKKLERTHNVMFVNVAAHLDEEVFQGEFHKEDIETILNTIALSTPFTYKVEQNKITIME